MKNINIYKNIEKNFTKVFSNEGYDDVNIVIEKGSQDGDGYVAVVVRALITAKKNDDKIKVDAIVKCAKSAPEVRKSMAMTQMFCREIFFYKNVIPYYKKIQDNKNIPEDMKCDFVNFLSASTNYSEEYIAMENMKMKGYKLGDKADWKHAEKAFHMLGKLHGLSKIFEKEYKKEFEYAAAHYKYFLMFNNLKEYNSSGFRDFLEKSGKRLIESIDNIEHKRMLEKAIGNSVSEKFLHLISISKRKVISHGDFWLNNMFFKYENNEPVKVLPIDFQLARYESSVNDFLYFMGGSSEADLRRNHFWELFEVYYNSFKEFVTLCGYDADQFYTYEDLKKELYDQAIFTICVSILLLPFFTSYDSEMVEPHLMFSGRYPNSFLYENKDFKKRVNDLVTDYVAFGLIN